VASGIFCFRRKDLTQRTERRHRGHREEGERNWTRRGKEKTGPLELAALQFRSGLKVRYHKRRVKKPQEHRQKWLCHRGGNLEGAGTIGA